jgi:hypothetical protein
LPRDDQVTRHWQLLQHLGATARGAMLQELTGVLPANPRKHLCSIWRDLKALEAAGFPLPSERAGWSGSSWMASASRGLFRPLEGPQLQAAFRVMRGSPVTVEALFDMATSTWAKDRT